MTRAIEEPAGGAPAGSSPAAVKAVPVRHYGRWVTAAIVLLLTAWLLSAFAAADIDYGRIPEFLTSEVILQGLWRTILLSTLAQVAGIVLGVVFAVMRLSKNPVLTSVSWFYIWFFRGTPVIVQLTFWFAAVPLVFPNVTIAVPFGGPTLFSEPTAEFFTPFLAALLGLGLNEGAYMAEIVRAGIISVDAGQSEAALALGMTPSRTMRRIVLPQAMRVIVPPTGNEYISMLKTSSLATVTTFGEMFNAYQNLASRTLLVLELLLVISIWYLVLTSIATGGQFYIERYFARGSARELPPTPLQRLRRNLRFGRVPATSRERM